MKSLKHNQEAELCYAGIKEAVFQKKVSCDPSKSVLAVSGETLCGEREKEGVRERLYALTQRRENGE
ncbi:hypothetical protein [Aneurinibacillus soli]|uniref:hypothetical protein n=1 Tax=Aneurinibacillus soli TaxID=1500254 RepID=UPI001E292A28|nr:hypothetical protein [Aneurinibacillus soli]